MNEEDRTNAESQGSTESSAANTEAVAGTADDTRALEKKDDRRRRRRAMIAGGVGLALLSAVVGGGVVSAAANTSSTVASSDEARTILVVPYGSSGSGAAFGYGSGSSGSSGTSGYGYGSGSGLGSGSGSGSTSTSTATDAVAASAGQKSGVVTISSTLGYESAESRGTGIILTSDGMILTNNHVVAGATSIEVTDETTGTVYTATVVGTDATNDIAVLQLVDASGLTPATLDASSTVAAGDAVTAVGNAGGTGDLVAATGTVTATEQTITTEAEGSAAGETLDGLIQVDADIVSGDSGGPLLDADGEVVGINTAASSGTSDITGFAIPISDALDIVAQIEAGSETGTVTLGYPAFLGVELSSGTAAGTASGGATIAGVVSGTPAATAGLAAGDTITAVDGTAIASADALTADLAQREPGESVTITWIDSAGASHSAAVVLVEGPVA